jgi:putative tryptophan/tyrosine transport system substrate-binding protein
VRRLHELGWIEGSTVKIEYRWAEEHAERLNEFAADLAGLNVSVIVTNALALKARLPDMNVFREEVAAGSLLSYGPSFPDLFRRAAELVDKIMRGANPADMPVEQPTKFNLVINLKTDNALGLTISPNLLVLADEVIE